MAEDRSENGTGEGIFIVRDKGTESVEIPPWDANRRCVIAFHVVVGLIDPCHQSNCITVTRKRGFEIFRGDISSEAVEELDERALLDLLNDQAFRIELRA